ncbi:hypothetical protein [Nucisporomicrobium flavum]|uniref:hypothetical protein n=1 Tax=Nucisporomicrobium flavum TaxID=2785915 RepID=UPI0018F43FB1|nr:hypothetical protein [Nucisporomicrobium flavum]
MAEDPALRLRGYGVYRIGGHELDEPTVEQRLDGSSTTSPGGLSHPVIGRGGHGVRPGPR